VTSNPLVSNKLWLLVTGSYAMVKIVLNRFAVTIHANIRNSWKFSRNCGVEVFFRTYKWRYLCVPQQGHLYCFVTEHLAFFCHEVNIFGTVRRWFSVKTPLNEEGIEPSCYTGACCSKYYRWSRTEFHWEGTSRGVPVKEPVSPPLL